MKILWVQTGRMSGAPIPTMLAGLATDSETLRSDAPKNIAELIITHAPDLVVVRLGLGGGDELPITADIKRDFPSIKVCVMLAKKDAALVKAAEASGADIVAPEDITPEELMRLYRYSKKHYRVIPTIIF